MATEATSYPYHPAACIFPMLDGDALDALVEDIRLNGLQTPVELFDRQIIDGRNRSTACLLAGVKPDYVTVECDDPVAYVLSKNLHRRHLTESQRAMVAARVKGMYEERAKQRQGKRTDLEPDTWQCKCGYTNHAEDYECGECHLGNRDDNLCANLRTSEKKRASSEAADSVNVGSRSVEYAEKVIDSGNADLIDAVDSGDMKVSKAARVAALPLEAQQAEIEHARSKKSKGDSEAHVSFNSGLNEWYTPAEYIEAARLVMGGIDLDPASSDKAQETVQATSYFTADTNGLGQQWSGRVWMNPPYASELIGSFISRLIEFSISGDVKQAIVLVNNATESSWFQSLSRIAKAICFPAGRIRFLDRWGNPGAPLQGQAFVYVGTQESRFLKEFGRYGFTVTQISRSTIKEIE